MLNLIKAAVLEKSLLVFRCNAKGSDISFCVISAVLGLLLLTTGHDIMG